MPQIIIRRTDGGVDLGPFADKIDPAEIVAKWELVHGPAASWRASDTAQGLGSRYFREAWQDDGAKVSVNMPKARVIKTDIIRAERNVRLADEDVAYLLADEQKDDAEKQRIATKKQALRDLPATIQPALDAIATGEELETWQPTWPA